MANYATVAQLRNFRVGGELVDLGGYDDATLLENIELAESIVESYVNTIFYTITQTVYFNGNGNLNLYVAQILNYPIISASTCTDVNEADEVLWTFTEGVDFVVKPWYLSKNWNRLSARLVSGSTGPTWPVGLRNIKVEGTWGRSTVPVEVKRATLLLATEISKPGSSGMLDGNTAKEEWSDYKVEHMGTSKAPPEPSDTTGFEFTDRLLDKWRFRPDLFLTPETHVPTFTGLVGY
jgi:hypothetical protein